jgi:MFS family permease
LTTESPKRARLGTSLLFFLHGLIVATWLSRIPAFQGRLRLNPGELGLALLGTACGALVSMPITGALVSRLGSRAIATTSSVLMAASLLLLPLTPNRWWLTAALVVFGICSGAMNVSMNAQAVFLEQRGGRAIMSSFHALFSLGAMAGAALGGFAAAQGMTPWRHFAIGAAIYIMAALVSGPMLFGSDRGQPGQPAFARITRPLAGLGCLAFCILLNEGAMADWSSVYMRRSLLTSEATAATGYAAFSFAMAAGRLAGDWMTEHFGRVSIVRFGASLAACGLFLGLIFPSVGATLAAFIAVGAGFSAIVPLAFGAAGRNGASPGAGLAAVNTAGYLGFLSGPAIIGLSANLIGLRASLGIVVVLSVLVASLARVVAVPISKSGVVSSAQEPVLQ